MRSGSHTRQRPNSPPTTSQYQLRLVNRQQGAGDGVVLQFQVLPHLLKHSNLKRVMALTQDRGVERGLGVLRAGGGRVHRTAAIPKGTLDLIITTSPRGSSTINKNQQKTCDVWQHNLPQLQRYRSTCKSNFRQTIYLELFKICVVAF